MTTAPTPPDLAVPLAEMLHHGQHVNAVFILSNGCILAVDDWYTYDDYGTYKVYSGGDKFHIAQGDVLEMATPRHIREVVLDV